MEVDFTWQRAVNDEGNYNPERNQEVGFIRLRINSKQRLDFAIELSYLAINQSALSAMELLFEDTSSANSLTYLTYSTFYCSTEHTEVHFQPAKSTSSRNVARQHDRRYILDMINEPGNHPLSLVNCFSVSVVVISSLTGKLMDF